ncbi:MAG TPA: type II secretion system protein GspK [Lamprocystis sp. (in: g-proteobacteria)]|nr:type II secretion system protein GspK [Lamprocystis sp. (in: g-proteobacteria)]
MSPGTDRGIALVLVLWVLTLLTVMAVGMTAAQRTETALTENHIADARFRALTDAAIVYTMFSFLTPPPETTGAELGADAAAGAEDTAWVPNGAPRPLGFDGNALIIAVYNEQSRINLNLAPAPVLSALMVAVGVEEEEAGSIADAIVDWRDEDDLKSLNGAEDPDYEDAGQVAGAKDAPFVAVEELQQVLGVTRELYLRLAPEITVDTENDQVEQSFASAAVLAALQGIPLEEAQLQVQERDNPSVPGGPGPRVVNRGGPLYRIQVKEQGAAATARGMEALVELAPGQTPPYQVRWRRFGLMSGPPSAAVAAD